MESFDGKVAVITGGGSGMGRAFANRFGAAGCRIVVADVEAPALDETVAELETAGVEAIGVVCDVSSDGDMDELAARSFERFGQVDLAFLNAGVGGGGPLSECNMNDWRWVFGVNLFGVANGLRVFLPNMLERGSGHIINTASVAGMTAFEGMGVYNATKHAVVALSETLYREMHREETGVGVSVLCPGIVKTRILDSARNRPEQLTKPGPAPEPTEEDELRMQFVKAIYDQGMTADEVAEIVHEAVQNGQFYIFTDRVYEDSIAQRHADIQAHQNPTLGLHLLEADQTKRL